MATLKPPSNIYGVTANRPVAIKNPINPKLNAGSQTNKKVLGKPVLPAQQGFNQQAYAQQMQDKVNQMYDAQKSAQLQTFYNQRDRKVGQINQQKAELLPMYANKRNQADVVSNQNIQGLKEQMAAQGLQGSGENVTASVGANNARLGALAELNMQQQQQTNDLDRRIADINDPGEEQALINGLEAQRMQALYESGIRADDVAYSRGRDAIGDKRYDAETAYSHGRDAIGDKRYASETAYSHGRDKRGDFVDDRNYNRDVFTQDRSWNHMSPADREMMAAQLSKSLSLKAASKGRSSGGGGKKSSSTKKTTPSKKVNNPNTQGAKLPGKAPKVAPQTVDAYARKMAKIEEPDVYQAYLVAQDKKRREELAKEKAKKKK